MDVHWMAILTTVLVLIVVGWSAYNLIVEKN
ncbi:hypothetical protein SAMN04488123_1083 [Natribacillus halophilus]|uniref:Uncharacterized protein n=1 Tax=Natribacillus halophilus TaxID=549003 RepID=A0A1G8P895_9BACI|nr:hypothetical protein SAMN04488123_1083 [Natribacillus halophilus]